MHPNDLMPIIPEDRGEEKEGKKIKKLPLS
jgi:hypothetical protein